MADTSKFVTNTFLCGKISVIILCILVQMIHPVRSQNCVVKGQIYTKLNWYGYLVQKTFKKSDARITYQISYPVSECCVNLLIYYDDQVRDLKEGMTCKEREAILPVHNNQMIPLSINGLNASTGCQIWNKTKEPQYLCTGERSFRSGGPRTWYLAVSRCDATTPLSLNYYFNLSGFYGDCEVDPLSKTTIPEVVTDNYYDVGVVIGLGVVCGITTIAAIVFCVLFSISIVGRREKKGGSVTSSQATMTQDIFYVNPSLSDREQSDSQYSHSQSSGSENYYEVIPDRRSYESINTQLAMQGHGLRLNAAHLKDARHHHIPAYILEDYPPPPYQPPNLQNGVHQRQSSAHAILQSGHYAHNPHALHTLPNGHVRTVHPNARPLSQHFAHHVCSPASASGYQPGQGLQIQQQQQAGQGIQQQKQTETPPQQQQQQPKTHAVRPSSRTSGKSPVHSESPHSNSRTPPIPNGNIPTTENQQGRTSQQQQQQQQQQQHLTTPKSPQNGHTNEGFVRQFSAPITKTPTGGQHIQLQTYGQNQNGGQTRAAAGSTQTPTSRPNGVIQTPNGRPLVPNGNVAKLLHDAYRIQQFETTA